MSIKAMTLSWELNVKSSEKLVLLALADHANDDFECYPSLNKIATKCGLSRRGLINIMNKLEHDKFISKETRLRPNGSLTSNLYHLHLAGSEQNALGSEQNALGVVNEMHPHNHHIKSSTNNIGKKLPATKPKDFTYAVEFEELWKLHNIGDKWAGFKAWNQRHNDYSHDDLAKALIVESKKQFGKRHFATVLNGDIDEAIAVNNNTPSKAVRYV